MTLFVSVGRQDSNLRPFRNAAEYSTMTELKCVDEHAAIDQFPWILFSALIERLRFLFQIP
jgi:hypothetical protein